MTFEIYALREIGSTEIRYVGQTSKGREVRKNFFFSLARNKCGEWEMRDWFTKCAFQVEAIQLMTANTRDEAKAIEFVAIQVFWATGHRLLNRQGLPREIRRERRRIGRERMPALYASARKAA